MIRVRLPYRELNMGNPKPKEPSMGNEKLTLEVLNPRGKGPKISEISASRRLSSLSSKKIGIIYNTKPGGEILIPYLKAALRRRFPDIEFPMWEVNYAQSPEFKEPILKEIAECSDGVIALMGD